MSPKDLEAEVLKLPREGRAALAAKILESLEEHPGQESERRWIEELKRRDAEFDENPDIGIPEEEVLREARARLIK